MRTVLEMLVVGDVPEAMEIVDFEHPFELRAQCARDLAQLEKALRNDRYAVAVSAVRLQGEAEAGDILAMLKQSFPFRPVVMVADPGDADQIVVAYEQGLDDKLIRCEQVEPTCQLLDWAVRRCLENFTLRNTSALPCFDLALRQATNQSLHETLILFDGDSRVLYFNKAAEELARRVFEVELEVGATLDELYTANVPVDFRGRVDEYIARAMGGETVFMREETTFANGTVMEREYSYEPLYDPQGHVMAVANTSRDLEEIRLIEHQLEESEARFWRFFERLPVGIGIVDAEGRWVRVNPALQEFFGYDEDALVGKTPLDLTHSEDLATTYERIHRLRANQLPFVKFHKRYLHREGHTLWADVMAMPLNVESKPDHFIGIISDISQRKQLEDQLQQSEKIRLIGQLAGGVAHDFNNLLTIISSYTYHVLDEIGDDSPHSFALGKVLKAAQRGSALTEQLLAFSRRHLSQPNAVELGEAIDELSEMIDRLIRPRFELHVQLGDDAATVWIDQGQLEQALLNLVLNARDAMRDGGTLRLETERVALDEPRSTRFGLIPPGRYGVVQVKDDGAGIPPEVLEHIFEPFFTTKDVGQGTGLGLASVWGIVTQAGGFIDVESVEGRGTTFSVYLPIAEERALD
ncbi:PAS domain S-box protein [Persicimonas caeni]|uniref:histidine kinase n=1 Tax=Persicimonas caeni TaxID=2292766 RepID=A0A4Y6PRX0_PERCE|nr:PAS domain S-box protein [Persicimonas caeni]QDG50859.1 PAS domain S-box protein [Persicimonas caeni]QED32080.1 PAS domain S-box protein [Persicimonas caeni]